MKGYFSQLAHRTGLVAGPGRSSIVGNGNTPAFADSLAQPSDAPGGPLHVEEISLTASPQDAAATAGLPQTRTAGPAQNEPAEAIGFEPSREITTVGPESSDSESRAVESSHAESLTLSPVETPARPPLHIETVEVTPLLSMKVSPVASEVLPPTSEVSAEAFRDVTPESKTLERGGPSKAESSAGNELEGEDGRERHVLSVQEERHVLSVQEYETQAVSPELSEMVEITEARFSTQEEEQQQRERGARFDPRQPAQPSRGNNQELSRPVVSFEEQTNAAPSEVASREESFQNYLREIVEWVSAPPVMEAEVWEKGSRAQEAQQTENTFAVKHDGSKHDSDVPPASLQTPAEEGPEVQDLNLSIGTISVVIEEQKPQAAVLPPAPPPPRAQSTAARADAERTSLGRYYLRSL